MADKLSNKRRNYFIKKKFQIGFIYRFIALILLEAILIAALLMCASRGTLTTAYYGTRLLIEKTPIFFLTKFIIITVVVGIAIGLAGLVIFIYLSHRIAGPLFRFEKTIGEISKGDLSFRVNLRKADQLKSLQEPVNTLLTNMDEHIKQMKNDIDDGLSAISEKDIKETASYPRLKEIFQKLKKTVDFFKTTK